MLPVLDVARCALFLGKDAPNLGLALASDRAQEAPKAGMKRTEALRFELREARARNSERSSLGGVCRLGGHGS